jgi:hypothetical protein
VLIESVDLVYLDPPFNSARNYNVLFAEQDGTRAAAQIRVFEDTWEWDRAAAASYEAAVEAASMPRQSTSSLKAAAISRKRRTTRRSVGPAYIKGRLVQVCYRAEWSSSPE